jgi:hypothetical protein
MLRSINVLVYTTMKAERNEITEAMVSAVTSKVDDAVSSAIARALSDFPPPNTEISSTPASPPRKKHHGNEPPENADMSDVGKEVKSPCGSPILRLSGSAFP